MINRLVVLIIRGYQVVISPLFSPACRFSPTCSEYARQAFSRYSLVKAFCLSGRRILKCHPFHNGGLDPLP